MKKMFLLFGVFVFVFACVGADTASALHQYLTTLGDSTDYEQVHNLRQEIFFRNDLSMEQKKNLSNILTQRYNSNLDNEYYENVKWLQRAELGARAVSSVSFQTVYWTSLVFFPGASKYTSLLDTWGRGIADGKSGEEIAVDMGTDILLAGAANKLDDVIKGTKAAKAVKSLPSKAVEKLSKTKVGENMLNAVESVKLDRYHVVKNQAKAIREWAEDVLTKPDRKLSAAEKLRKDIAKKLSSTLDDYAKKKLKDKSSKLVAEEMVDDALSTVRGKIDSWAIDKIKAEIRDILQAKDADAPNGQGYEFVSEYAGEYAAKNESEATVATQGYEFLPEYANADDGLNDNAKYDAVQKNDVGVTESQIDSAMEKLRKSEANSNVPLPSDSVLNNADVADSKEIALEEWEKQIENLGKDMSADDRNMLQQVGDMIRTKIEEVIAKGEEWVKNGGIRDLIQTSLDKALDGKVSDADKARIKNLADKLCNIGQDGGRSFAEALGTDGEPLLRSLAVQQLQNQISKALPKDVADNVNNYIQMLAIDGYDFLDPVAKQQLLDAVKSAISEYLPYETSAATLNTFLQDIYDGKSVDVLDAAKNLGNSIAVDALRDAITKNMPPEVAGPLLSALDGYVQSGFKLTGAVQGGLDALIDKYAPGSESAAELKNVLNGIMNGTATADDLKRASSAVFADRMKVMIDESNLSPEVKRAAKDAIDVLKQNGISGATAAAETFINDYVTDKLGPDAGKAASDIFHAMVTPGTDVWSTVKTSLPTIAKSIGTKILAKVESVVVNQIDNFIKKHPVLKEIFGALGIDGTGIVNGIKNIWGILKNAKSLQDALSKIGTAVVQGLKNMLKNLVAWGLEKLSGLLNNLVKKAAGWIADLLGKWSAKMDNALLKKGLDWLQSQATKCRKCGAQKVLSKLSAKAAAKIGTIIDGMGKGKQSGSGQPLIRQNL